MILVLTRVYLQGGFVMNEQEILRKAEADEGLTVEEIKVYQKLVPPVKHVYGKYGTLAKEYLEKHNFGKYLMIENIPEYLHGIDKAAEQLWNVMYEKLSRDPKYRHTKNYLDNVRKENEIKRLIEEEILSEIVYVD